MNRLSPPDGRKHFLIPLGLALLLAGPSLGIRATKPQLKIGRGVGELSRFEAALAERETRLALGRQLPFGFAPSPEFAPFGAPIKTRILAGDQARGKLLTNLGHADWDAGKDSLIGIVPAELRGGGNDTGPRASPAIAFFARRPGVGVDEF